MKKRIFKIIIALTVLLAWLFGAAVLSICISNAYGIHFSINFVALWLGVSVVLLGLLALLALLKKLKKCGLNKTIAVIALLTLTTSTASAAVYVSDRHHDSWFYDLEEQLTAQYSSIECVELSLDRWGPTLMIECHGLDLPSDSDEIVKEIKDTLRIGSDDLFKRSYTGRNGDPIESAYDLDLTVIIYSDDERIEYTTGYYLGYDHTESGTVDQYHTWIRQYGERYDVADGAHWFETE